MYGFKADINYPPNVMEMDRLMTFSTKKRIAYTFYLFKLNVSRTDVYLEKNKTNQKCFIKLYESPIGSFHLHSR